MKILQVKKFPIYDIFTDLGWLNWTRILIDKNKKISVIAGEPIKTDLSPQQLQQQALVHRTHNQWVSNANKSV
jgi:hypothetical protein